MVRSLDPPCDCLVLTGDLIHDDKPVSYDILRSMLRASFPDSAAPELRVVAGNHDLRDPLVAAFAAVMDADAPSTCFAHPIGGWLLLGLDTLDDQTPNEGGGRISAEELAWLRTTLAANVGTPTVLFCHHPPVRDIGSEGFMHGGAIFGADDVAALAVRPTFPPPLANSKRRL